MEHICGVLKRTASSKVYINTSIFNATYLREMLFHLQYIGDASSRINFNRIANINTIISTSGKLLSSVKPRRTSFSSRGPLNQHEQQLFRYVINYAPMPD